MTATALAYDLAFDTALDVFDDVLPPARPQLRVIQGAGLGSRPTTAPQPVPQSLELYRRRRFAALALVVVAVLVALQFAGVSLAALTSSAVAVPTVAEEAPAVHVVLPGDTYGAIAASLGAENPSAAAELIRIDNGGGELVVGQRIVVPNATLAAGSAS